ncbi:glycine N-acyltransferase-like protein 3 [Ambystoma mexicanum]|uniref:glycine N-acyltransferase-like protein 3 n=1 Tax=Ambystoma mexicanum TaxID=8296 RepID=UPI0037E8ADFE
MQVVSSSLRLQALETLLAKHLPESLKVFGAVKTINRGNPFKDEVVVDSWPNFRAIITRPQQKYLVDPFNYYRNAYSVFYKDLDAYRDLLENTGAVNSGHAFQLHGHQEGVYEASEAIAVQKDVNVKLIPFLTVQHLAPAGLKDIPLKMEQNVRLSTLKDSHDDLLNRNWMFGGIDKSKTYLGDLRSVFHSACVLDEEGNLLSWVLTDQFSTMTHSFTIPEDRQKGYQMLVITTLSRKLHSLGYPLQGVVLPDNEPQKQLLKRLGFSFLPCPYFRLIHTPNMSSPQHQ